MRKQRGFTLIELLVVVTIIALLIAILIPSLGRARDRAKISACASNLKQIVLGANLYATDWSAWYPPEYERGFCDFDPAAVPYGNTNAIGSQMLMYAERNDGPFGMHYNGPETLLSLQIVSDGRIFFDPATPYQIGGGQGPQKSGPMNSVGQIPSFTYNLHTGYFYQDHSDLNPTFQAIGGTAASPKPGFTPPGNGSVQPVTIPPSTAIATAVESPASGVTTGLYIGAAYPKTTSNPPPNVFFVSDLVVGPTMHGNGSGLNGAFFDGHVEYIDSGAFRKSYLNNSWDQTAGTFSNKLNTFEVQSMHNK